MNLLEVFEYTFFQNAVMAGILVSISAGIIGSLIVANRMVFLAGGIAHASYGGIGLSVFLKIPFIIGSTFFALIASILTAFIALKHKDRIDTFIGVMWALGMAIGIILVDLSPGYNADLMSYLFGSILSVSSQDLIFMLCTDFVVVFVSLFFYHKLLAVSYDSEFAKLKGINTSFFYILLLSLCGITIVMSIRVVGLILVIALLTIPVYIAEQITSSLAKMMLVSSLLSMIFIFIGLLVSFYFNLSSGASIILISALSFSIFFLGKFLARR